MLLRLLPGLPSDIQTRCCADLVRLLSLRPDNSALVGRAAGWEAALFAVVSPHCFGVASPWGGQPSDETRTVRLATLYPAPAGGAGGAGSGGRSGVRSGGTALELAAAFGGAVGAALEFRADTVLEYQRWLPVRGWGTVLLPTDPGKWSDESGASFGATREEVEPSLPSGWEVCAGWCADLSDGAWQHSPFGSFRGSGWAHNATGARTVRRRAWRRTLQLSKAAPAAAAAAESLPPPPDGLGAVEAAASGAAAGEAARSPQGLNEVASPLCRLAVTLFARLQANAIAHGASAELMMVRPARRLFVYVLAHLWVGCGHAFKAGVEKAYGIGRR